MEINRNEKNKTMEVWLTKAERNDQSLRDSLKPYYKEWKEKGYLPVVYLSGNEDLYENTLELLKRNRNCSARREVEAERAARSQTEQQTVRIADESEQKKPSVRKMLEECRAISEAVNSPSVFEASDRSR